MKDETKKRLGCLISILLFFVLAFTSCYVLLFHPPVYETNDIANYGIVKGNYDNDRPQKFVSSFFPEKIEDYFSNVTYHYKAKKGDTYAYEMYLEFVIEDNDKYTSFISNVIGDKECETFYFAPEYQVCYISNYFTAYPIYDEERPPYIDNARVGLILFSKEQQRVIFFALGMYDGGGANVKELGFFFERFNIDPLEYDKRSTPGYAS